MILKLEPKFFDKIWGGKKLKDNYHYPTGDNCGECWGISAHPNGSSIISSSPYKGKTLKELFENHKKLFGNYKGSEFPILVKIIDATDNLSIQVHPGNEHAKKENSLGKEECWYILDADKKTEIIIGHKASSIEQLRNGIKNNTLEELCNSFPIEKDDFFYINAGTLHAIRKGTTLLEVQQSSDITYRLYDYNRLQNGKPRDLHVKQALEVLSVPDEHVHRKHRNTYFTFDILENKTLTNNLAHKHGDYIFIIEGQGTFDKKPVKKGDFLMVTSSSKYQVFGNLKYQKTTF